jgi:hypothetical protein
MSRYAALTAKLLESDEHRLTLSFSELDAIVGGLPESAKKYGAWWANNINSQAHSRFWLDAGRRASPDFRERLAVFTLDAPSEQLNITEATGIETASQILTEYVESSLSLERDLENHIINHLESLEPGLKLVSRQETIEVGRLDILAKDKAGRTVIIELKAGEAKDAAIGQIARYIGWFTRRDTVAPRAMLVAGGFSDSVKYAAMAIPGLKLVTYRVSFNFDDATI